MVDSLVGDRPAAKSGTWRSALVWVIAIVASVPAMIHFAVAGDHFQEYWAFGVFMLVVAWLQLAWVVGVVVRPTPRLLAAGAALNMAVIVAYVVTRTVGDVIGPTPAAVEPVGLGDAVCTACEALVVIMAVLLTVGRFDRAVPRAGVLRASAAAAALAAVLLSVALVDGGPEMAMSMDESSSPPSASISLDTDSPAGPITMPAPDMQMAPGMQMADGSCTQSPTTGQQHAAVRLVDTSWTDARKYQSLAAAKTAGYRPVTPTGRPVVHYLNPANYRAILEGGQAIDPSAPASLVYANTPSGAVLAAVMYIQSPRAGSTSDPGGCLTQWHVHTNLCFARGQGVVGVTDPTCPAGSVNRTSPPMLHIWFVPIPGGPTAIDATDRQIVHAAEHVPSPRNPTA